MGNRSDISHHSRRVPPQSKSDAFQHIEVRTGRPLVTKKIAANRERALPCTPLPSVGKPGSAVGRRSHLFKVPSFVSINGDAPLSQDDKELFYELLCIQRYYDDQRANAPIGTTTPEVQSADWKRIGDLVNALKACPEFSRLSPALGGVIDALQPLLSQPGGQARYNAWTAFCRASKARAATGNRVPALPSSPPPRRQVSSPAPTPAGKPAASCLAACRDLAQLRDNTKAINGWKQINWRATRALVNSIVASDDFTTRFTPRQRAAFKDLQRLNSADAGSFGRFKAWESVQLLLPKQARAPVELPQLRRVLNRLINESVWMTADTDAFARLCRTGKSQPQVWGAEVAGLMGTAASALDLNASNTKDWMLDLRDALGRAFPSA